MSNTGHKHISKTMKGWYVVSVPASLNQSARSISRKNLSDAIFERNQLLGYDPDARVNNPLAQQAWARDDVHEPTDSDRIVFGALGDTHLASKYERTDALHKFYDELVARDVKTVFNTGNYIEGEARFNQQDVKVTGFENQIDHFIQHYPERKGVTTWLIDGDDHEGWYTQREGIEVGRRLEQAARDAGRNDIRYLGYMEADVLLPIQNAQVLVRVLHAGGGSSKAVSLAAQNIIDSYTSSELPHILLIGHYHKSHFLPNYRGVNAIQTGTFQEQTPFMRKKKLVAAIGGWAVSVTISPDGRPRVGAEYLHYEPYAWRHHLKQAITIQET